MIASVPELNRKRYSFMQLTLFTDYALRTLVYLALQPEERLSTITEVADKFSSGRRAISIRSGENMAASGWRGKARKSICAI